LSISARSTAISGFPNRANSVAFCKSESSDIFSQAHKERVKTIMSRRCHAKRAIPLLGIAIGNLEAMDRIIVTGGRK